MGRLRWVLLLGLAAALVAGVVICHPRSREQQVREACREFLDACLARDFEEIWDLHSAEAREEMAKVFDDLRTRSEVLGEEGLQLQVSVPTAIDVAVLDDDGLFIMGGCTWLPDRLGVTGQDDEELFVLSARTWLADHGAREPPCPPWFLSAGCLRDLRVKEVTFTGQPEDLIRRLENLIRPLEDVEMASVTLKLLQPECGAKTIDHVRLSFVRRWGGWGLYSYDIKWSEILPPPSRPPSVAELLDQVRTSRDEETLDLECEADLPWPDANRILLECARSGLCVVALWPTGSPESPRATTGWGIGIGFVTDASRLGFKTIPGKLRVSFPGEEFDPAKVDAIVEVPASDGFSHQDRKRLKAWLVWLLEQDPDAVVLLAPRPEVTCGRAAAVAQVIHDSGVETLLVATPGTAGDAAGYGEILLNGQPLPEFPKIPKIPDPPRQKPGEVLPILTPGPTPSFPPVPRDHPALRRVIR